MKRTLWDLLRGKTLLQEAFEEGLDMLLQVKYMYIETNKLLFEEVKEGFDPYSIDKQVNKREIEIREKILKHLAFGADKVDIAPALSLSSIVIDIERIGDYCKNMFELVEIYPEKLDEDSYIQKLKEMSEEISHEFDVTYLAFKEADEEKAKYVMKKHLEINKILENLLREVAKDDSLKPRKAIIIALLTRYLKRVSAHLKNVASSIVNPYPKISFQPESKF
ncbi:MAG: PhoU domain-containing protein [candidate division WOR-3 bacterium]|jgi:phosphate uptake regulator|uniref:Phosphate uptake regulator PhoU n=1 Tax=candidate division WOR-3 bacterium TaxID=2052148 RepID=A0A7V3KP01_UNCW3